MVSSALIAGDVDLQFTPDFTDTTTTTAVYAVNEHILDDSTLLLYKCILINTAGILLTNATYFEPVTTNALTITDGAFSYVDGLTAKGDANRFMDATPFTGSVDFTGESDGITWSAKKFNLNEFIHTQNKPKYVTTAPTGAIPEYQFACDTKLWYDLTGTAVTTSISWLKHPNMIASETPQYEDLTQELEENVMDSLYVDKIRAKTIEAEGKFIGKNACTAWVNFDGTTTPPTIRDSYNVSDVVRTSTGVFDVYLDVDNANYSAVASMSYSNIGQLSVDTLTDTKFRVVALNNVASTHNPAEVCIQVFGGKN